MAESDNILTKLQDLLVYLLPQLNKFPRDQKFVLGDRIETKLLDVQEDCLRAYYRCWRAFGPGGGRRKLRLSWASARRPWSTTGPGCMRCSGYAIR
jgi:hypothetical protein